jgi:hypothetical protein
MDKINGKTIPTVAFPISCLALLIVILGGLTTATLEHFGLAVPITSQTFLGPFREHFELWGLRQIGRAVLQLILSIEG